MTKNDIGSAPINEKEKQLFFSWEQVSTISALNSCKGFPRGKIFKKYLLYSNPIKFNFNQNVTFGVHVLNGIFLAQCKN